jgi:hypothetical protein
VEGQRQNGRQALRIFVGHLPLHRGLRGGDHDDAGDCSLVQDRTATLRLSKRVWLCRDAIHRAKTARPVASPRQQPPDAMRPRRRAELRIARSGPRQANVSTAYGSTVRSGRQPSALTTTGADFAPLLAAVRPCIAERSAQRREPLFWAFSAEKKLTKWGALGLKVHEPAGRDPTPGDSRSAKLVLSVGARTATFRVAAQFRNP